MQANGTLFCGRTAPLATTAADGTFTLTLLAFDRMGPHTVEPWRLTYSGPEAQQFWAQHASEVKPGQAMAVHATRMRTFTQGRFNAPEIHASVTQIRLLPPPSVRHQLPKEEQSPMTEPIVSRARIEREATAAAQKFSDVNTACPYPFDTEAGRMFKEEFNKARGAAVGACVEGGAA
jgi:hypothetical protein